MSLFDPLQWGRVNRGRVWHVLADQESLTGRGEVLLCGAVEVVKEATQGLPPTGGTPCAGCLRKVEELAAAGQRALANAVRDTLAAGTAAPADFVGEQADDDEAAAG